MIVAMKKLSLLIFYKDYRQFLDELRERGVVHIHENRKRSAEDDALQAKLVVIKRIGEVIKRLEGRSVGEKQRDVITGDGELLDALEGKYHRQEQIVQQLAVLQKEYSLFEPWGKFSPENVNGLRGAGWDLRFFTVSDSKYLPEWEERYNAIVINEERGQKYFVTLMPAGGEMVLAAEPFVFPSLTAEELTGQIEALKAEAQQIDQELDETVTDAMKQLEIYLNRLYDVTDGLKVDDATDRLVDNKVIALEGWIPSSREEEMRNYLREQEVYFEMTRPTPEDHVPVLLKNNFFTRLFEPITEMFALPNYNELDPTPFFAPFFMLFFGLCMGDGGYGLLIWLVCFLLGRKASVGMKGYYQLGQFLGISTVIVGFLTGSFFGIALDGVQWDWLKGMKEYFLTEANYGRYLGGYNPMMIIAVVVGVIQILFGMCVCAAKLTKQYGFNYARSTVAWVVVLLVAGVVFGLPMFGIVLPFMLLYACYGVIGVCVFVILFLNSPGKGIIMNLGSALWGTYNMATGLLGDTLSYIRLFALGLTGSILGGVFNTLAFDLTSSLPLVAQFIAALLILLVGHTINFGLCLIGAFVHPMRLTFVEFYKNAGFEGGGAKYAPFKNRVND